eukprot:s2650_g7.t1
MSGSSNDHLRQADDQPDDTNDIFSTLPPRQLNVLYGVLINNSLRAVFMDQLQDMVVANADSIVRGGPPRKAMPKVMPKITLRPRALRRLQHLTDLRETALCGDQMWLLFVTPPPPPPPPPRALRDLMILDLAASIWLKLSVQRLLEMLSAKAFSDTTADLVLVPGLEVLLLKL